MPESPELSATDVATSRPLGLISTVGIVISSMVGAGIYTTSGYALADLGHPALVLAAWLVAGGIALCGAVGYGALSRLFQESGGEYLFLSRTIHPAVGFLAGCVSLLAGFTGAIAFAATALEAYTGWTPEMTGLPAVTIAVLVILVAMLLHLFHVQTGAQTLNLLVVLKFLLLLLFLLLSAWNFPGSWPGWNELAAQPAPVDFSLSKFCMSLVWISLSYCGFNAAIYAAGEVREAAVTVPRSMLLATGLVLLFYLALNFVFVFAPGFEQIAGQEQVALIAAQTVGGTWLAELLRYAILVSLFTSVSVMIMTGPRVYAKMAEEGFMPGWLGFQKKIPQSAIVLQSLLAVVVVYLSTLKQLLSYLGVTLSLSAALTVASLFWLKPQAGTPQQLTWPVRLAAGVFVVCTLVITLLAARHTPGESALGLLTVLGGIVPYLLLQRYRKRAGGLLP